MPGVVNQAVNDGYHMVVPMVWFEVAVERDVQDVTIVLVQDGVC